MAGYVHLFFCLEMNGLSLIIETFQELFNRLSEDYIMEKLRKIISWAVPILCITTSVLVMLYLFEYISNVYIVFVMSVFTFIISALNLLIINKNGKKRRDV